MHIKQLMTIAICSLLAALSLNAAAGYLVNYEADPFITCDECHNQPQHSYRSSHAHHHYQHHYYHHRHYAHSRSHYSIQVYYTWNPYPDYGCGTCGCSQQQSCRVAVKCARAKDYNDGFATYPVHEYKPCQGGCNTNRDYDTSTADDNYEY